MLSQILIFRNTLLRLVRRSPMTDLSRNFFAKGLAKQAFALFDPVLELLSELSE
jgi:hypothetical protein